MNEPDALLECWREMHPDAEPYVAPRRRFRESAQAGARQAARVRGRIVCGEDNFDLRGRR